MKIHVNRKWLDLFLATVLVVTAVVMLRNNNDLRNEIEKNRRGPGCVIALLLQHREASRIANEAIADGVGTHYTLPADLRNIPVPEEGDLSEVCEKFIKEDLPDAINASIVQDG